MASPQKNMKVSIQGYEGSFHQVAAQQFFGKDVEKIPLPAAFYRITISYRKAI
jgi:prephenate dehydratase